MKRYLLSTIIIIFTLLGKGQDVYYSQFSTAPMYNNPANAGYYQGMKIRTQYHDQWRNVSSHLKNINVSLEFSARELPGSGGIGLIINSEPELYGIIKNSVGLVGATRIRLNRQWVAQFGFSGFFVQKSTDFDTDNYVGSKNIDPRHGLLYRNLPIGSSRIYYANYVDLNVGGIIGYESEYTAARFGISVHHVTHPNVTMIKGGDDIRLPLRFSTQGDFSFLSRRNIYGFTYHPSYLIEMQGKIINYNFGMNVSRSIFYIGLFFHQATFEQSFSTIIPNMGIFIPLNDKDRRLKIGYSYEIPLQVVGDIGGIHEITLRFEFDTFQLRKSWKYYPMGNPDLKRRRKFI